MAASQTTNRAPAAAGTHYLDGRLMFMWDAYGDGDNLTTQRLRIWDNAASEVLWDSLDVEMDDHTSGDGWMVGHPEMGPLEAGTAYKWDVRVSDDAPSDSAYSTKTAFTMGAAEQTGASWRGAQ